MISIDARSVRAQVTAMQAVLRGRRDALLGAVRITITPTPDGRTDGVTNTEVLARLSTRFPTLVAVDDDMARLVRLGARLAFDPMTSTLREIAAQAGPLIGATIARRLRSGRYVTNTAETLRDKARRGAGQTPGVDSEQLARSFDRAVVRVE